MRKLAFLGLLCLASCAWFRQVAGMDSKAQGGASVGDLPYAFSDFKDIPVPEQSSMNMEKTSIFGRDANWVGKVVFGVPFAVSGMYDFYMSEMPKFGWVEITSVRGNTPALVFIQGKRVSLIQINPGSFEGSVVTFTMAPTPDYIKSVDVDKAALTRARPGAKLRRPVRQPSDQQPASEVREGGASVDPSAYSAGDGAKRAPGSLGIGDASNYNYNSSSPGVGRPPEAR
ncbi:MAG: hypothetical protein LBT92_01600 [Rickettsiales bacterium]|jgi:hypothetical protein|nr:hypothetical protein [Rickettsiales bacterium]